MTFIKFTSVKLILHILSLICVINLLTPKASYGVQRYAVQVAASKTPLDIPHFTKRHKLTDSISEIKSEFWYRYIVGIFENLNAASQYANKIALQNGINGAFPYKLNETEKELIPEQPIYPIQPEKQSDSTFTADSIVAEPKKTEITIPSQPAKKVIRTKQNKNNYLFLKLIGVKNTERLKKDMILLGNKHLPVFSRKFYIRVIERMFSYPIILLFVFLILIFIFNVIIVLLVLYYSNQHKNQKERYIRIYRNLYEEVLRSYLFGEIEWEKAIKKLKKIKIPLNREILTSVLFNFQENLRGDMDNRVPAIFVKLDLHKDARKKSKSTFYYSQIQGIRELTNLYPEGALAIVNHYINAPNDQVRAEAQTSYVRLHPDKPFDFFKTLTSPFTRWTQLSAFHIFRLHQLPVPSFVDYLDSEHPNVRNFCLRMIIYFQQVENATEIFELLKSPLEITRFLSIRAINDLRLSDGKEMIKNIYAEETEKNKLEIIKAIKNIGNASDFEFLESIIRTGLITLKTEACRSMYYMNAEGRERLSILMQDAEMEIEKYIDHITDPRN